MDGLLKAVLGALLREKGASLEDHQEALLGEGGNGNYPNRMLVLSTAHITERINRNLRIDSGGSEAEPSTSQPSTGDAPVHRPPRLISAMLAALSI